MSALTIRNAKPNLSVRTNQHTMQHRLMQVHILSPSNNSKSTTLVTVVTIILQQIDNTCTDDEAI